MTHTPEQVAALEWLEDAESPGYSIAGRDKHRATIKAMLAAPRLPPDPTPEIEQVMWKASQSVQTKPGWDPGRGRMRAAYHALYAHLTKA